MTTELELKPQNRSPQEIAMGLANAMQQLNAIKAKQKTMNNGYKVQAEAVEQAITRLNQEWASCGLVGGKTVTITEDSSDE